LIVECAGVVTVLPQVAFPAELLVDSYCVFCVERFKEEFEAVEMCRDEDVVGVIGHEAVGDDDHLRLD
jgi:hypothetical protein